MNEPHGPDQPTDRDGGTTLTDEEIETRPLDSGVGGPASSTGDDTGDDTGDTGDDTGDTADTSDTGDDSGDLSDPGDDSGDDSGVA
jgi:hypothetical protein